MIPDFQTLMLPVLRVARNGEVRLSDAVERLAVEFRLTGDERNEQIPSGRQTVLYNRVSWAKNYLGRAALLRSTRRGHFEITDRGREILATDPARIDIAFLAQFAEFQESRRRSSATGDDDKAPRTVSPLPDDQTPDEIIRAAHRRVDEALRTEVLERVLSAPPDFFERLVITLLEKMGYGGSVEDAGHALGRSGDDGVDGMINQDVLGLDRVYIQAKRYARGQHVSAGAVRDFSGSLSMHQTTRGVFATTSGFTTAARETAEKLHQRIVLIDGDQFATLMIRYDVGVRVEETLHIKKIDEDFFPE